MSHLGIDPGTANIGVSVTDDEGNLLTSYVLSFEKNHGMEGVVDHILQTIEKHSVTTCGLERFVTFRNTFTKTSEQIIMLIGCLWYVMTKAEIKIELYRSIEWKQSLCRYLVKEKGFTNPSTKFDKKYSLAVAETITKEKIKNDHIADSIGLSRMWAVPRDVHRNKSPN